MKKIILISAVTLFSTGVYADDSHHAKGCDESSLKGQYGYEVSGVNAFPVPTSPTTFTTVTQSTHVVGQARFNGKGDFSIAGYGSAAGYTTELTGHGEYIVDPSTCTAKGSLKWMPDAAAGVPEQTSNFYIVLDRIDNSDGHSNEHSANKAHHASVLVDTDGKTADPTVSFPSSASGSLTKFVGKF